MGSNVEDRGRRTESAVPDPPGVSATFTFSLETYDDCLAREFCRPPDQILRALAGDPRVTSLAVVDPWRSRVVDLVRGRGTRLVSRDLLDGRPVVRLRPRRLRLREPTSPRVLRAGYARLGRIMAAHAGPVGSSTALVTVNPFIAAWSSDGFDRCIYFGRDDWARLPAPRALVGCLPRRVRRHRRVVRPRLRRLPDPGRASGTRVRPRDPERSRRAALECKPHPESAPGGHGPTGRHLCGHGRRADRPRRHQRRRCVPRLDRRGGPVPGCRGRRSASRDAGGASAGEAGSGRGSSRRSSPPMSACCLTPTPRSRAPCRP